MTTNMTDESRIISRAWAAGPGSRSSSDRERTPALVVRSLLVSLSYLFLLAALVVAWFGLLSMIYISFARLPF